MARLNSAYQRNVMLAMAVYVAVVFFVWPQARAATALPLKALLALAPVVPMSVACGVVSAVSLAGGFLSASGVVALDGDVLIWVMPALAFVYGITHLLIGRRYGGLGCS